jgi:hypothetical protein
MNSRHYNGKSRSERYPTASLSSDRLEQRIVPGCFPNDEEEEVRFCKRDSAGDYSHKKIECSSERRLASFVFTALLLEISEQIGFFHQGNSREKSSVKLTFLRGSISFSTDLERTGVDILSLETVKVINRD